MTLEQRIGRLESTTRRWRNVSVALALLFVLQLSLGQAKPEGPAGSVLSKLTIVDDEGRPRIVLNGKDARDGATATFLDPKGVKRIVTGTYADRQSGMIYLDTLAKRRMQLGTSSDGQAAIIMSDTTPQQRIYLETKPDGVASMTYYDATGRDRIQTHTNKGSAATRYMDPGGVHRSMIATSPDGSAVIMLGDRHGKPRVVTASTLDGYVGTQYFDGENKEVRKLP